MKPYQLVPSPAGFKKSEVDNPKPINNPPLYHYEGGKKVFNSVNDRLNAYAIINNKKKVKK